MDFPIRINKYLALQGHSTRRGADALIENGKVYINGTRAQLGSQVQKDDRVEVRNAPAKKYIYIAYNKPVGVITHSPQKGERDVVTAIGLKNVFPVGRLDKASSGLLIVTNDGRVTDRLLNPNAAHEKEYEVVVREKIPPFAQKVWGRGVDIGGYTTKPAAVRVVTDHKFRITLTEGKKHQVRRMCEALHLTVVSLTRVRINTIKLGTLRPGEHTVLAGRVLEQFLQSIDLTDSPR